MVGKLQMVEVFNLFIRAENIEKQSTEGFGSEKIEFVIDTEAVIDFSFLEQCSKEKYAILTRIDNFEPIYGLVYSANYFKSGEDNSFYSNDIIKDDGVYYICGKKAKELFDLNPFIYRGVEIEELYEYESVSNTALGMDYMVFICKKIPQCIGKTNFILIGNNKSIDKVFNEICENTGDTHIYLKDVRDTKVKDRIELDERGNTIVGICVALVVCSLVIIIYWWYLQYKEYERAGILIGKKHYRLEIIRDFATLLFLTFVVGNVACFNYPLHTRISSFAIFAIVSLIVVVVISLVGSGESINESDI